MNETCSGLYRNENDWTVSWRSSTVCKNIVRLLPVEGSRSLCFFVTLVQCFVDLRLRLFLRTPPRSCNRLDFLDCSRWSIIVLYQYRDSVWHVYFLSYPDKRSCVENNKVMHRECPVNNMCCRWTAGFEWFLVILYLSIAPDYILSIAFLGFRWARVLLPKKCSSRFWSFRGHRERSLCCDFVKRDSAVLSSIREIRQFLRECLTNRKKEAYVMYLALR